MVTRIIILVLIAASAEANWFEQWANGLPKEIATSAYPIGWSNSVAWWKFDTTSTVNQIDSSIVGTNFLYLIQTSAAATNYSFLDNCFTPDDYVTGGTPVAYLASSNSTIAAGLSNYTAACWVNLRVNGSDYQMFFTKRDYTDWAFTEGNPAAGNNMQLWNGSALRLTANKLSTNNWIRLVIARTNTTTSIYRDGSLVVSTNAAAVGVIGAGANTWRIGFDLNSATRTLRGSVDDVYITTYVFSSDDASSDYNKGRSQ